MQQELFEHVFRIIFLGLVPIIAAVTAASFVGTVIQSSLAVKNECFDLVLRLLALVFALYFFMPGIITSVLELFTYSYGA